MAVSPRQEPPFSPEYYGKNEKRQMSEQVFIGISGQEGCLEVPPEKEQNKICIFRNFDPPLQPLEKRSFVILIGGQRKTQGKGVGMPDKMTG